MKHKVPNPLHKKLLAKWALLQNGLKKIRDIHKKERRETEELRDR